MEVPPLFFDKYIMKTIICTIARNEGLYIEDWALYHLAKGFDEIYVFDNGTEIPFKNQYIKVIDYRNETKDCPQMKAYNWFVKNIDYDWCAFIDVDEFITGPSDIKDYIKSFPTDTQVIKLNDVVYGDDGLIFPQDISIPVYNRILTPSTKTMLSSYKLIVKKNENMFFPTPHKVIHVGNQYNSDRTQFTKTTYCCCRKEEAILDCCYIRHYKTKTLSEFCKQKLNQPRVFCKSNIRHPNYYFRINEETPEKIEYINKHAY